MKVKQFILYILLCTALLSGLVTITVCASTAKNKHSSGEKAITSIYIEDGDTLWDIANTYYTKDCKNIQSYIKEIKKCNNLTSDDIHAGNYLIIPYYQ